MRRGRSARGPKGRKHRRGNARDPSRKGREGRNERRPRGARPAGSPSEVGLEPTRMRTRWTGELATTLSHTRSNRRSRVANRMRVACVVRASWTRVLDVTDREDDAWSREKSTSLRARRNEAPCVEPSATQHGRKPGAVERVERSDPAARRAGRSGPRVVRSAGADQGTDPSPLGRGSGRWRREKRNSSTGVLGSERRLSAARDAIEA